MDYVDEIRNRPPTRDVDPTDIGLVSAEEAAEILRKRLVTLGLSGSSCASLPPSAQCPCYPDGQPEYLTDRRVARRR